MRLHRQETILTRWSVWPFLTKLSYFYKNVVFGNFYGWFTILEKFPAYFGKKIAIGPIFIVLGKQQDTDK